MPVERSEEAVFSVGIGLAQGFFVFSMNDLALKYKFPSQQVIINPVKLLWLPDKQLTSCYTTQLGSPG